VNGADGAFFQGLTSISSISYSAPLSNSKNFNVSFSDFNCLFSSVVKFFFSLFKKSHDTLKNDSDSNAWISLSLSTISLTATD
jgi:hypothetical protein